ncbi:MAG: acyl carrier protein [Bryobacteraceae bacterium]|nr:acyl carrier protein [Bryobacteraceae bacterium]
MVDSDYLPQVLEVIQGVGGVSGLAEDQDIYEAGVTSLQALPLLMELEERFGVSIADDQFITARTPRDICAVIAGVKQA